MDWVIGKISETAQVIAPDLSQRFSDILSYPFLTPPDDRLYSIYLISFVLIGVGLYFSTRRKFEFDIRSIFRFLFPREIYLNKSSFTDLKFYIVDRILARILKVVYALSGFFFVSEITKDTLTLIFDSNPDFISSESMGILIFFYSIAFFLTFDFADYVYHYLFHKVPILWEFHKVHHSAAVLTPMTTKRFHPVEIFIRASVVAFMTGIVTGVFAYLLGQDPANSEYLVIGVLNITIMTFAFNIFANLRHSHLWLSYGLILSHILYSPAQHQIHHSCEPRHADKNLGRVLSVWDWIFGTLYIPRTKETFEVGLQNREHEEYSGVIKLYVLPFKKAAHRMFEPT
jgi:sterol desaturase/sphingolipid hydroxylase (fatty acid hydroxylase superfamily)